MFQNAHALPLVATLLLLGVSISEKAWSQGFESIGYWSRSYHR